MSYLLYSLSFGVLVLLTVTIFTRHIWIPLLPPIPSLPSLPFEIPNPLHFRYTALDDPGTPSNFHDDAAAGLHSSNFDLAGNIEAGDGRAGLDAQGKREVQRMMKRRGVGFDEARRMVMLDKFRREGVAEDGRPRDPKFVSFS